MRGLWDPLIERSMEGVGEVPRTPRFVTPWRHCRTLAHASEKGGGQGGALLCPLRTHTRARQLSTVDSRHSTARHPSRQPCRPTANPGVDGAFWPLRQPASSASLRGLGGGFGPAVGTFVPLWGWSCVRAKDFFDASAGLARPPPTSRALSPSTKLRRARAFAQSVDYEAVPRGCADSAVLPVACDSPKEART